MTNPITRREMLIAAAGTFAGAGLLPQLLRADDTEFKFRYILGSSMYGYTDVREILPEVSKIDATAIDIWPKVHGNQREQLDELGEEKFAALLKEHDVHLGCITQYKLGPFGLADEMKLAQRFGCATIVTGAVGPKDLKGDELKSAVSQFIEQMKPHLDVAAETGVTIAIENHSGSLLSTPDSINWLVELRPSSHLAIALAPYHLPQEEEMLCDLIRTCGNSIAMFYAWQHGMGCMEKLPKEQELLQMPGRGDLKFQPLVAALREIEYAGWTEIFMHPVPRGIPILEPTSAVTEEINRARAYLAKCLAAKG
ncbi:MAG: sugar phosphate isomerase/epimerase family protein [Planctomycetaceae bacterium]